MSQEEIIRHWQQGARDALEAAQALHDLGKYALALFDCHLAVEKALKAAYITKHDREAPPTHNLLFLTEELGRSWTQEQHDALSDLTDYAVAARYDDPEWAKAQATKENSTFWLKKAAAFLAILL
jgi:HEPN domain-containing protein